MSTAECLYGNCYEPRSVIICSGSGAQLIDRFSRHDHKYEQVDSEEFICEIWVEMMMRAEPHRAMPFGSFVGEEFNDSRS